jgi:hypothetical protein
MVKSGSGPKPSASTAAADKLKQFLQSYKNPQQQKPTATDANKPVSSSKENRILSQTNEPKKVQDVVDDGKKEKVPVRSSPLLGILEFVDALTAKDVGGKVIVKKASTIAESSIQYMLLDPSEHFRCVLS